MTNDIDIKISVTCRKNERWNLKWKHNAEKWPLSFFHRGKVQHLPLSASTFRSLPGWRVWPGKTSLKCKRRIVSRVGKKVSRENREGKTKNYPSIRVKTLPPNPWEKMFQMKRTIHHFLKRLSFGKQKTRTSTKQFRCQTKFGHTNVLFSNSCVCK